MSMLCLLEVSQLRTKVVDGRGALQTKIKNTRNKSNDYFKSLQYRQDVRHTAHYHKRKHFPSYTRCSENHNNMCAEKSENTRFDI